MRKKSREVHQSVPYERLADLTGERTKVIKLVNNTCLGYIRLVEADFFWCLDEKKSKCENVHLNRVSRDVSLILLQLIPHARYCKKR